MTDTSREALIKMLIECLAGPAALTTREATAIKDAADMLEADGKPKNFLRLRGQLEQEWAEVRALKEASKAQQVAVPAWTIAEERMPKPCVNVLAYTGKAQPIRAQWVPAKTLEDNCNSDFGEYDESTDLYYWPEAWYETNEHEETHWMVDDPVTHWMPLPPSPQGDT